VLAVIPAEASGPKPSASLRRHGFPPGAHAASPWEEFSQPDSPKLDFVITVCDNAAKEVCPVWPGQPISAHWGVPDPAAVQGSPDAVDRAYRDAFVTLDRRISLFLALPWSSLDRLALKKEMDDIGKDATANVSNRRGPNL